jgi:hypothetical protein
MAVIGPTGWSGRDVSLVAGFEPVWPVEPAMQRRPARTPLVLVACSRARHAGGSCCTTTRQNTHKIEEREVLYRWHPWFGRVVRVDAVIEKGGGFVCRCCTAGEPSSRCLELPAWMFDRAACTLTRSDEEPIAELAALHGLRVLLSDIVHGPASSNAPVLGATSGSHDQNRRASHATRSRASSSAAKHRPAARSVRPPEERHEGADTRVGGAASANPHRTDGVDDAPDPGSRSRRRLVSDRGGAS